MTVLHITQVHFAVAHGLYHPGGEGNSSNASFSFSDVYDPVSVTSARFCEARVWCVPLASTGRFDTTDGQRSFSLSALDQTLLTGVAAGSFLRRSRILLISTPLSTSRTPRYNSGYDPMKNDLPSIPRAST